MRWQAEIKVGILVATAAILLTILLTMASDWNIGRPGRDLVITFERVQNLKRGAAVHIAGVAVGKVVDFRYDDRLDKVVVRARLESPVTLRQGFKATIGMLGIIGEAYVALTNGPRENPPLDLSKPVEGITPVELGELVEKANTVLQEATAFVQVAKTTLEESRAELRNTAIAIRRLTEATTQDVDLLVSRTDPFLQKMTRVLDTMERRLPSVMDRTEQFVARADEQVSSVTRDARAIARQTDDWLTATRAQTDRFLNDANLTLKDARDVLTTLTDESKALRLDLSRLATTTETTVATQSERLNATLAKLDEGIARATSLIERLDTVASRVDRGEGTLGSLVSKDTLLPKVEKTLDTATQAFESVNRVAKPIERLQASASEPIARFGAELTYRSAFRGVQNELAFEAFPQRRVAFLGAVSTREGKTLWNAVVSERFGPIAGRIGFVDSESALGLDWTPRDWVTIRAESLGVSRRLFDSKTTYPRVDVKAIVRPVSWGAIVFGAENVTDEVGFMLGARAGY